MPSMPRRARLPFRAGALAALALCAPATARPGLPGDAVPAAPDPSLGLARAALADLRVFLDFDDDPSTFAAWPVDKFGRKLPAAEIARGIRLGALLWASVLPDMRFRFAQREAEANLIVRFGPYRHSGFADAGGRAFLPSQWARPDGECGRRAENRRPGGARCGEWEHGIIILQEGRWAVRAIDWRGMRDTWLDFAWIFDAARPHFRTPEGCRDGRDREAAWDEHCVPFRNSPFFDSLPGVDLAAVFMHELGHTFLGDHVPAPYACVDKQRRPIVSRDSCVRQTAAGFTVMFPGDGVDGWWNKRGVFDGDAALLRSLGYRTCYPRARAVLVLTGPGGRTLRTRDWREAARAMIWPLGRGVPGAAEARRQLFLTGIEPDGP
jgi:hypothetical protein